MKKIIRFIDNSETMRIILDRFLIGLLILFATSVINKNLETIRTKNSISENLINKFIDTTNEVWMEIDKIETLGQELTRNAFTFRFEEEKFDKNLFLYQSNYSEKYKQYESKINKTKLLISQNDYILGGDVSNQFYLYLEYLKLQYDSKIDYYLSDSISENFYAVDNEKVFATEKRKYKFNLLDAQKYAIEKFLE